MPKSNHPTICCDFPGGSDGKASACNAGDPGSIPTSEDPLEKEMAIHSSTLASKIPWTEEPNRLQSMGSQRVGHDWATSLSHTSTHIPAGVQSCPRNWGCQKHRWKSIQAESAFFGQGWGMSWNDLCVERSDKLWKDSNSVPRGKDKYF